MSRAGEAHVGVTVNGLDTVTLGDTGKSHNFVSDSGKRDEVVELKHPLSS